MASVHTCADMDPRGQRCWDSADNGVLGYGNENRIGDDDTIGDDETPAVQARSRLVAT